MRINIIKMLNCAGSGHPGGSLSCCDILSSLYFGGSFNFDPNDPKSKMRDRFILSKGHCAPALYALLSHIGWIEESELANLRKQGSILQGHPDCTKVPGIEVSTGSLGQGLSIGCGLAHALKLDYDKDAPNVFVLMGDGEIQEGQVWEAALFAKHYNLNNLIAIVDNNELQIDGNVLDVAGLDAIALKFASFGFKTLECDGHDIDALKEIYKVALIQDKPVCILAHTIKGKGVSFMENQAGWHGVAPNDEQAFQALSELGV
ncbi:MAG: transketolase [Coriobacteriales bacterium]|nr:transketolase [Coriobacteriales bacterium]